MQSHVLLPELQIFQAQTTGSTKVSRCVINVDGDRRGTLGGDIRQFDNRVGSLSHICNNRRDIHGQENREGDIDSIHVLCLHQLTGDNNEVDVKMDTHFNFEEVCTIIRHLYLDRIDAEIEKILYSMHPEKRTRLCPSCDCLVFFRTYVEANMFYEWSEDGFTVKQLTDIWLDERVKILCCHCLSCVEDPEHGHLYVDAILGKL